MSFKDLLLSTCLTSCAAVFASGTAYAQNSTEPVPVESQDDATEAKDDIVVTANRRAERLQDVPISVTAYDGDYLRENNITNGIDIVARVPGLQVSGGGGGTTNGFNIRGVTQNAFAASLESPIAVYLDDSYLSVNTIINLSLFDIERVEVLRGPQGTLFGRNATGGMVRYVTSRPSSNPEGFLNLELGEDTRIRVETAASGPISDTISARISGVFNYNDGLIENDIGPDTMQVKDYAIRGQILVQPNEDLDILLKAQYSYEDDVKGGYSHVAALAGNYNASPNATDFFGYRDADGDPYTGSFDFNGFKKAKVIDLTANIDWSLGDFILSSVTNYQDVSDSYGEDSDVSPLSVYHYVKYNEVKQFTQEFRVAYESDRLKALVGTYYLIIDGSYGTNQTGLLFFGPSAEIATADQKTTSYALFAQTDIEIAKDITLVLGGRYSHDKKDFVYNSTNLFGFFKPGPVTVTKGFSDGDISFKAQLNYRPNSDWLIYGGVNRGIKSGGLNFPLFPQDPDLFGFDGETLTAYEAGFKSTIAPNTTLNVSVFHYNYKNYQAFSFDGLAARVINVNAKMYGGELELNSSPTDGLDLNLGMSFLSNKVRDVPLAVSDGTEKAAFTPKWTVNGLVKYSWDAFAGTLSAQLDGNWRSSVTFNLVPTPVLKEPGYALFNARIGYQSPEKSWSVAAFAKNLTNKYYRFYSFDTSPDFGSLEDVPGIPRWFGVSASYKW